MLLAFLKLIPLMLLAHFFIVCGVFFASGQLFPSLLEHVYNILDTAFKRMLIALVFGFFTGNMILAYAYKNFDPGLVTPMNVCGYIIVFAVLTIILFDIKPTWMLVPALLTVMGGCIWVQQLLSQSPNP